MSGLKPSGMSFYFIRNYYEVFVVYKKIHETCRNFCGQIKKWVYNESVLGIYRILINLQILLLND